MPIHRRVSRTRPRRGAAAASPTRARVRPTGTGARHRKKPLGKRFGPGELKRMRNARKK